MKKFILRILVFFSTLVLLVAIVVLVENNLIESASNFTLKSGTKYIVLGHSHPECALNDSVILNFENLANQGESYFYTYLKLKKILENNSGLENIFLEFTNNQIEAGKDNWIWGDKFISYNFPRYTPIISIQEFGILLSNNGKALFSAQSKAIVDNFIFLVKGKEKYLYEISGYYYLVRNNVDSTTIMVPHKKHASNDLPKINIGYLEKIVSLCKSYGIPLHFIRTPLHKNYDLCNELKFKEILTGRFSEVEFIDFKDYPLFNSEYGDLEHLNHKGAKEFSVFFNTLLESDFTRSQNKKEMLFNEIQKRSVTRFGL